MTAPHRSLCLIHANCQGDPLAALLAASPQFAERYEIRRYTNYLRERIAPAELSGCGLFLYQHLGEKWDDHASDRLLAMVNPAARVLRLPNMLFTGYWPFWTNKSPMDFGDAFLDRLVSMGLSMAEILHVYLHGDIAAKYDLDAMLRHSLAVERDKERGAGGGRRNGCSPPSTTPTGGWCCTWRKGCWRSWAWTRCPRRRATASRTRTRNSNCPSTRRWPPTTVWPSAGRTPRSTSTDGA